MRSADCASHGQPNSQPNRRSEHRSILSSPSPMPDEDGMQNLRVQVGLPLMD